MNRNQGQALKILGVAGGASVLTRMHLYLIMEIALLYGKDIEDQARVPEMVAKMIGESTIRFYGGEAADPLAQEPV